MLAAYKTGRGTGENHQISLNPTHYTPTSAYETEEETFVSGFTLIKVFYCISEGIHALGFSQPKIQRKAILKFSLSDSVVTVYVIPHDKFRYNHFFKNGTIYGLNS